VDPLLQRRGRRRARRLGGRRVRILVHLADETPASAVRDSGEEQRLIRTVVRQIFTSLFIPGGTAEQTQWFNDLQRMTASPHNAARLMRAMEDIEIEHLLPKLRIPTLVMHCRGDARVPFDEGRRIAMAIKGARFVALEGRNHLIIESEPARGRFHDEIKDFLSS
jgi:pimeloyl-ACP methyl ester carboxylesterase